MPLQFQLVTPEKTVLSEELVSLTCPTEMGEITILPGHIPLVATLVTGELHAKTDHDDHYIYVAGGFVEVRGGNKVVILADDAEHHFDIDVKKAEEAKERAEKALKEHIVGGQEYAKVAAALNQNLTKLRVARKHSSQSQPAQRRGTLRE